MTNCGNHRHLALDFVLDRNVCLCDSADSETEGSHSLTVCALFSTTVSWKTYTMEGGLLFKDYSLILKVEKQLLH